MTFGGHEQARAAEASRSAVGMVLQLTVKYDVLRSRKQAGARELHDA